jgi:hypothetical protein
MKKYKVLNETGVVVEGSDAPHAVGEVIDLDETSETTQAWVASGAVELVPDEVPAPTPRVVAQADLDANPILTELTASIGDTVSVTKIQ